MDIPYESYEKLYDMLYEPEADRAEALKLAEKFPQDIRANTSIADYVWLPLRFVESCREYPQGMVFIDWKDEWRIEDYD